MVADFMALNYTRPVRTLLTDARTPVFDRSGRLCELEPPVNSAISEGGGFSADGPVNSEPQRSGVTPWTARIELLERTVEELRSRNEWKDLSMRQMRADVRDCVTHIRSNQRRIDRVAIGVKAVQERVELAFAAIGGRLDPVVSMFENRPGETVMDWALRAGKLRKGGK